MRTMEKSDLPEVARKRANKAASAAAEPVERRGGSKENPELQSTVRTQSREAVSRAQARTREAVTRNRKHKLTALLHHVNIEVVWTGFFGLKKIAAPVIALVVRYARRPAALTQSYCSADISTNARRPSRVISIGPQRAYRNNASNSRRNFKIVVTAMAILGYFDRLHSTPNAADIAAAGPEPIFAGLARFRRISGYGRSICGWLPRARGRVHSS